MALENSKTRVGTEKPETTDCASVIEVFDACATKFRSNIAVRSKSGVLTYQELSERVSSLAHYLQSLGIKEGDLVGVSSERRYELAVALLAILKVGAGYVPIEESYPESRLAFIAKDTGIKLVLGESAAMKSCGVETLPFRDFPTEPALSVPADLSGESIAYIMYTSGSTGNPKGVVVPHRAILRLVIEPNFVDLGPSQKILQNSPVAFDASTLEIWGALLNGGELVVPEETDHSLRALGKAIADYDITMLWLTAGLFHAVVDERPTDLAPLKQLLTGGDVVSPVQAAKLLKLYPKMALINGYGPTENTTFTCCHRIRMADVKDGKAVPIGSPISGTDIYVLDENLNPVAPGEKGELCASGKGLSLGYWKNKELTAEKFIKANWDKKLTLYRTGDMVRMRKSGVVEFVGRVDQQVKIRGFRVELGEIEAALGAFKGIQHAVVLAEAAATDNADKILTAYFVGDKPEIDPQGIRAFLSHRLPGYAVPMIYHQLDAMPLTENGKVDRKQVHKFLKKETAKKPAKSRKSPERASALIAQIFAEVLGLEEVSTATNFFDLGASSLHVARVHEKVQSALSRDFPITAFFEYTTIDSLADYLEEPKAEPEAEVIESRASRSESDDDLIAIVGMAGKFPGAPDVATFWQNLIEGKETIRHFTAEELDYENGATPGVTEDDLFVKARGIIDGTDMFDARHFGIPPKEAEQMDPQHRLLLECAQVALEDAGHDPDRFKGKIGIFSGSSQNSYLLYNLCSDRQFAQNLAAGYPVTNFPVLFGNDKDFLPTRIAYKLNLRGPAVSVQCACSTSLVAVAQACENLQSRQCDMALAGGVSLSFPQKRDYLYTPDGMASSDGHCRAFDADASGTVFGEGAGLVVLRRLKDALREGDNVIAVIRGFAINNDGAAKAGYAAPSVKGQVDVILEAQKAAGVPARSIGYIEAHGTGTPLGDPIEFSALTEAFSRSTQDRQFCALGTGKTNVGHLDIAAGVTGLIKTALTVKHGKIPPLLHYKKPNANINFEKSAFFPVAELQDWQVEDAPRRAGVSAFGVGGTNIHMILEQAPETEPEQENYVPPHFSLLPVSATVKEAVGDMVANLAELAADRPDLSLDDIAESLQKGRREYPERAVLCVKSTGELAEISAESIKPVTAKKYHRTAFLFPGQGSQHIGMAEDLYNAELAFRDALDHCAELLEPHLGKNLIDIIYPAPEKRREMEDILRNTAYAQPAIFSIGYALSKLWEHWGIRPECMAGHSIGEFAAACLAGVFSLEDALKLIALRGRLMADLPEGVMISVRASEEELKPYLSDGLDLAAINGAKACVLSGPFEAADRIEPKLEEAGFIVRRLQTSHAFHSSMMDPIVETFAREVAKLDLKAPEVPILSTVTVDWMTDEQAMDPNYWASHLRQPVRFYDMIQKFWEAPEHVLIEAGPGRTLTALAGQNPKRRAAQPVLASLPHPNDGISSHVHMLGAFGNLWCHGYSVDWEKVLPEGLSRKRIALPPYPFQRKRFWVEPNVISAGSVALDAPIDAKAEVIEVAPASSDSTETRLKEVLSELSGLDVEELDSSASFLELGFDSLLLTQVGKEIRDVFGVAITLRQLIDEFQSLNDLIKHLDANALPDKISPMTGKDMDGATKTVVEGIELSEVSAPTTNISRSTGDGELTPRQKAHIENLIKRYNAKTPTSKQMTADYRRYHADPRTASGFNRLWKEIVYQIVTVKSKGSRLLDVDGNEYIDILNGFGPGFLGHSPEIVVNAVTDQLNKGFEVGPQSPAAMEAAKLFCEVTGNERTSFVCTGSEAVQAVMRLARTVTGRDKIVMFARDYHGNFDEVLVRGVNSNGTLKSLPMAPGIPKRAAGDMIVLPYGTDESLEIIRRLAPELAAVIVEPVQSRRPEFQPREFIREIRQITERSLTLFVFDEVVTGFRFGPRGAQEFYGVEADLVTYGKVVGGGMPVGVVSGKAEFMDTFDGGQWNYGDDSFPEKPVTFFAGTFVRHPLAMASVKAMLSYFKSQPSFFWKVINAKGDRLASAVDSYFREKKVPIRMVNCGSLMYVRVEDPKKYGHLLFAHLREKGVFILEDFPSYLTASHTDEDIDYLIRAFKESADELLSAGFFAEDADSAAIAPLAPALLSPPPVLTDPTRRAPDGPLDLAAISIPTTESQKEIWMATLINPAASTAYNESVTLWMKGVLDTAAIREAVKRTFQRHDALRSRFTPDGMEMLIGPDLEIEIPHVDLSGLDKVARKEKMAQILKDEVNIPFDHINGPYVRAQLVTQEKDSHALIITAHHIVCDGWSIDVIMHDVGAFYTALRQGTEPDLGPAQSIIDYARVERQWQLSHEFEESEKYWLDKFSGNVPTLDFPTDRPHPSLKTSNGARIDSLINAEVAKGLRAVCTREKCTFVNILFAAFNLYVYRLTGQHDMVIGMTSSGQSAREMEGVVGHCVNLLPIRSYIGNDMTLGGYLKSLRGAMLDAFDHQHYTYGTLIKNLKIHRDPSRVMLTPIVFNFDNGIDLSAMKFGGLETEFVANPRSQEHFEIFLSILDDRSKVGMEWSYNTDLFEDATIRQHIKGFHDLLAEIADSPDVTIDRLISGLDAKRPESGAPKINTYRDFPADLGVHQLFEKMAAETPDAIAVTLPASEKTAEETLSYGELNARANRLAHMLASKGIKAGDLVTLCVERNLNILVGMLGILKAGAAYVPLDPHFPPDRLSYMIADSKSKALVTEADILPNLGANGIANICLDRDAKDLAAQSDANPAAANMDADPLAYVIYTSGSTGKPKGVEVRHRGVVNFLTSMAETPGFTKDDRLLAVTTISFDIAVLELFLPLSVGGSLLLSRQEDTYDGDRLARLIEDHGITMLQATPATWRLLLDSGWQGNEQLTALCGGEALLQELGARLVHKCKALWNMYGPTETTIWSTVAKIDPDTIAIAIGQPIANTEVYILNADMRPVPRGVPGELYIGGEGLARGYLDQPEMTAERFVAHPFSDAKGARIYRTGDLARWLPSGDLECLGRVDRQVKVRGYRIELGEIESALEELDGIQQAAVIAREETPGDQRLIGYVVQEPGNVFSDSDILEKLGERLPKYMIPSVVAPIDEMPLTPNRKVNYRELPKVDLNLVARDETRPTTKLEEELVEIWRKVLNIDNIGVHADFFELGGHSLLAVRLFHQIRQKYSLDLPISTLFMNPTVQTLAEKLGEDLNRKSESEEEDWSTTTVIHPGGSGRPVFIVCGKGGNALELWALGQALGKNRPVIGLQTRGILGHTPRESIEEMAAEHIKYIRGHQESGPYHIAGYSGGGLTAFEIARQLQNRGEKVAFVGIIDTWAPGFHPSFESEPVQRLMYEISKLRKEGVGVFMNRLKAKIRNSGLSVRGTRLLTRLSPYRYRLRMLEADWLKSANRYQGGAYNGSITLFRSSPQTLYEEHIHEFKPTYGWEKFVEREIYEVQLVGNHLDILSDDVVENLAHAIERQIEIAEK